MRQRTPPWLWLCLMAIPISACSEDPVTPVDEDVGAYFQDLPSWNDFSPLAEPLPPTQSSDAVPLPDTTLDLYRIHSDGVDTTRDVTYSCVSVPYTMSDNPDKIVMYSPDREILWPGALIQGQSRKELGSLLGLPIAERTPINVSIPGLPSGDQYRTVDTPNQANVSAAVGEMIGNATINDLPTPTTINFKLETYHSEEQFGLSVGVSGRYMGFRASASASVEQAASENTVAAQFTEKMYEVVVEPPQTPDAFFSEEFTQERLQEQIDLGKIGPGNIPIYVSNVVYGRMMMFSLTSTATERDLRATMQAGYSNALASIETEIEAKYKNILEHSKIALTSFGGDAQASLDVIQSGDWTQYFTEAAPLSSAAPLSYTFRSLDGQIAMVTEATDYNIKICTPKVAGEGGLWFEDEQLFDLRVGTGARPVTGDFDGDGLMDLALNTRAVGTNEVEVLFGSADGVFQPAAGTATHPASAPNGWGTYDARAGDVNGDGRDDLVWNHRGTANITYVGLSDGAGGFTYPDSTLHWASGWTYPRDGVDVKYGFDVADVNGDGRDDILWTASAPTGIRIYSGLAQADGSFHLPSYYEAGGWGYGVYNIADVGGDGRADFVFMTASPTETGVGVLTANGYGYYGLDCCVSVGGDFTAGRMLAGDLDGDTKADNFWARVDGDSIRTAVLLANETGSMLQYASSAATVGTDASNMEVAIADLNGDGRDDVIVSHRATNESYVGLAGPDGVLTFDPGAQQHPASYVSWDNFELFTGDVDGDGREDLVWIHPATPARVFVALGN